MRFKSFEDETYCLKVNENDSVKSVVKQLAKRSGKLSFDILLIFENRILLHNDSIGKYEIDEEDFVLFDCSREYREFNRKSFLEADADGRRIQVRVQEESMKYYTPRTFVLEARLEDTIFDLKELLSLELEDGRRKFEFYKGGRLLGDDDKTLADHRFDSGDLLTIRYVTIRIYVIFGDKVYFIEVRPEDTIWELKEKLSRICGINKSDINLQYHAVYLLDNKIIDKYDIKQSDTIIMTSNLVGYGGVHTICVCPFESFIIDFIKTLLFMPIYKRRIYVEGHYNTFAETINKVSKENGVLLMQIDLFSDQNCYDKINNDSDYNIAVDRVIQDDSLKIYYNIKSKPSFSLFFVPINIDFEPFIIDCSGDCKSIIDRVSDQFKCPSHSLEYFTDREMSLQIENIDYFIRNCRQNSNIYFFVKFLVDNFVVIEELAEGAFGRVYKCREIRSSKIVAAKQFQLSGGKPEKIFSFQRELEIIKSLKDHSRIIKFEGQRETNDAAYLLMEYAPNGSLGQYTKKNGALEENAIANYAKQILEGLQYLHNNNIVHGDIKGDNILLDSNCNIKLCDFGLSKSLVKMSASDSLQRHINSLVGTVNWLAPEKICGEEYEFAADIWSFGATMIEMVTGHIPFYKYGNPATVMFKIGSLKQIEYEYPSNSNTMMKEFIDLCLQPDPRERANIDRLFNHQFLIKRT